MGLPARIGADPGVRYPDLPRDIDSEQAVLGAILLDNRTFGPVSGILSPDDFAEPVHAAIYASAGEMIRAGRKANPLTLKGAFPDGNIEGLDVSAVAYMGRLIASDAVNTASAADYALTIKQSAVARAIIKSAWRVETDWPKESRDRLLAETIETLDRLKERALSARPRDFGRVRWRDLDKEKLEDAADYLIEGLLTMGDRSAIAGPSQSGKSFLAIHAGMCVALGRDFFDRPVKQGLVIYQAGEGARGVRKRLKAFRQHFEVPADAAIPFELLTDSLDLLKTEDTPALIAACKAIAADWPDQRLALIVIDTFATATSGADENSSQDMTRAMKNVEIIQRETGAHVMLVHHLNAGGTKLRGHTSIHAGLDQIVSVTRNETTGVRTASLTKLKDDEAGGYFRFALHAIELGRHPVTDYAITSCVCVEVEEKEALRKETEAKGIRLGEQEAALMGAILAALKAQGQPAPADCPVPHGVGEVVLWSDVLRHYASKNPVNDDTTGMDAEQVAKIKAAHKEKHKKRVERAHKALQRIGVIGIASPYAWWTGKPVRGFPETLPKRAADPEPTAPGPGDDNLPF